jgi:trigger factor
MSFEIERPSLFERVVKADIPAEEVLSSIQAQVRELAQGIVVPGFRKGHVPTGLVEKRYWEAIVQEVENALVGQVLSQAEELNSLTILSEPSVERGNIAKGQPYSFTVHLFVRPDLEVKGLYTLKEKLEPFSITDDDVAHRLEETREQHAQREEAAQPAGTGLLVDISGTVKEGESDYFPPFTNATIELGKGSVLPGFDEQLEGMSAGECRDFQVTKADGDHSHTFACHVTLNKVLRKIKPALDDEFAQKQGYENLEHLKSETRTQMEEQADRLRRRLVQERLMAQLLEANPLDIPEALLQDRMAHIEARVRREMASQGGSDQDVDQAIASHQERIRKETVETLRKEVILSSLARQLNVEVGDEDVDGTFSRMAEETGMNVSRIRSLYDEEHLARLKLDLRDDKVRERLLDIALDNLMANQAGASAQPEADKTEPQGA